MAESTNELEVPGTDMKLVPGCIVKLGRFESTRWIVGYGWFSYGGNRPFCGWFLTKEGSTQVKPLQINDLSDIYMIENKGGVTT